MNNQCITVNFSTRSDVPLIKKFGLFNSGLVTLKQYEMYSDYMDDLRVDSLRIDLFMGSRSEPMVMGSEDELIYDFSALDTILETLSQKNSKLYASWCYIPVPLQVNQNWRSGPTNLDAWQEMFRSITAYYKKKGIRIPYNEIYNEPDCNDVFFLGTLEDYTKMYLSAVAGIKQSDSDAVVGGPSTAFVENSVSGIKNFLNTIVDNATPFDFFSYHSYGCDAKQYIARTKLSRELLNAHPELDSTELHLNEFNSLIQPFLDGGPAEHARGGATMLTAFQLLLNETDVTLAHWAQLLDTGIEPLGSVDIYGQAKAAYWAYRLYSMMPEERVEVLGTNDPMKEGLHLMASADKENAGILVWNDHQTDMQNVAITMDKVPIKKGTFKIWYLDDENGYPYETDETGMLVPYETLPISEMPKEITLSLKSNSFALCYFEGEEEKEIGGYMSPGNLIRKRYLFTERGKQNYAFYDETDPMVYLGMNGEIVARSTVAMEYENLPDMLIMNAKMYGGFETIDQNSAFSVRVDYDVDGAYVKSCLWTYVPMNIRRSNAFSWGTGLNADKVMIEDTLLTGKTILALGNYAPENWSGRAIITLDMQDAGTTCGVEVSFTPIQ